MPAHHPPLPNPLTERSPLALIHSPQFIIATIPTVLGVNESARLAAALQKEGIPCKRIVVNQLIGPDMGDK